MLQDQVQGGKPQARTHLGPSPCVRLTRLPAAWAPRVVMVFFAARGCPSAGWGEALWLASGGSRRVRVQAGRMGVPAIDAR